MRKDRGWLPSPKNTNENASPKRISGRNLGVSKKERWASLLALDAHPEEKDGNQRRAERRKGTGVPTIPYDKDMWISTGARG